MTASSPVDAYLQSAPAAQQPILRELRAMITEALPDADEAIESGFPVYQRRGQWIAGFATRKKGPMLYIMAPGILDRYAEQLGPLRSGRSCIEFRESRSMTMNELRTLARQMLAAAAATVR